MGEHKRLNLRSALRAGDWAIAVAIAKDPRQLEKFGVLRDFIVTAREAGDGSALELAEQAAVIGSWDKAQRYALAREFVAAERLAGAWSTLKSDGNHTDDPGFAKQARRIYSRMPRGPLRREIALAITSAEKPGPRSNFVNSVVTFPGDGTAVRPMSKIRIAASPSTPPRYVAGVKNHVEQYISRLQRPFAPRVEEISNVFVDGEGQIWDENGQIYKDTGKPKPKIDRDDVDTIELGFHSIKPTRGIYHWLIDRVPHLSCLNGLDGDGATILLSRRGPEFESETLALAGIDEARTVRVEKPVFVRRLLRPRVGFAGMRRWDQVSPILDQIKLSAQTIAQRHGVKSYERIYISRRDSSRRPLDNEGDIEDLMRNRGYFVTAFGEIPLWHQIFLASGAKEIVSPHGAGLSHIIFMPPEGAVTEIVPIRDGTYVLRLNYALLSAVRGLKYSAWIEPQPAKGERWTTHIDGFIQHLDDLDQQREGRLITDDDDKNRCPGAILQQTDENPLSDEQHQAERAAERRAARIAARRAVRVEAKKAASGSV